MSKGIEVDVLEIPASQIREDDNFYVKGQCITVDSVDVLRDSLIRITGHIHEFETTLIVDRRLLFPAVFRAVPNQESD